MEHPHTQSTPLCESVDSRFFTRCTYESPSIEVLSVAVERAILAVSGQTGGWHDPSDGGTSGHGSSDDGNNEGDVGHEGSGNGGDIGDDDSPGKGWNYEWDIDINTLLNPW